MEEEEEELVVDGKANIQEAVRPLGALHSPLFVPPTPAPSTFIYVSPPPFSFFFIQRSKCKEN